MGDTLTYATPSVRPKRCVWAATLLWFWCAIDIVGVLLSILVSLSMLFPPTELAALSVVGILSAAALGYWTVQCAKLGYGALHARAEALKRAVALTLIAEIFFYCAGTVIFLVAVGLCISQNDNATGLQISLAYLVYLFCCGTLTGTRLFFRYALHSLPS